LKSLSYHTGFWLLSIAVVFIFCIPALVQHGMFLDGVTYAAISKNLANGIGTSWQPQYTATFNQEFYGHPPVFFILQSLFFKLLGNHFMVERLFSFGMLLLSGYALVLLWRTVTKPNNLHQYAWLPLILWITIPQVAWTYTNNMLEMMVSACSIFSIYFLYRSTHSKALLNIGLGTLCMWIAYGVKGPVGLFPLSFFIFHYLVFKRYSLRVTLGKTGLILVVFSLLFALLFVIQPQSLQAFSKYHNIQVISALQGTNEITASWYGALLPQLLGALAPLLILCFVVFIWQRRNYKAKGLSHSGSQVIVFFVLLGLAGSLPLMITLKQRLFYAVPSFSLFAFAAALYVVVYITNIPVLISKIAGYLALCIISVSLLCAIQSYNSYAKDEQLLNDIQALMKYVPPHTIVKCDTELAHNWKVIAYLQRYASISISDTVIESRYELSSNASKHLQAIHTTHIAFDSFVFFQKK